MPRLTTREKQIISGLCIALFVLIGINWSISASHSKSTHQTAKVTTVKKHIKKHPSKKQLVKAKPVVLDWHAPSEKKAYPNLAQQTNLWGDVSIAKQRVYLKNGDQILYTMHASTGSPASPTPTGTFYIEAEHGESFYNRNSGEGAKYWRSFLNHGIYLFHSVPTDQAGNFITAEAEQLGKQANSHGCIRLSVADAQWFYTAIPYNTKVVIH